MYYNMRNVYKVRKDLNISALLISHNSSDLEMKREKNTRAKVR